jgi:hypothetical protein
MYWFVNDIGTKSSIAIGRKNASYSVYNYHINCDFCNVVVFSGSIDFPTGLWYTFIIRYYR